MRLSIQGVRKGKNDNEPTPKYLLKEIYDEFKIIFDPCPPSPTFDGLTIPWKKRNYCNPPYSKKQLWIAKALEEQKKGNLTVMLLPVDTSTAWFQDKIMPNCEVRWLRGRIKLDNGKHPMYASMLAIFNGKHKVSENT
jgi:hypothetical protein